MPLLDLFSSIEHLEPRCPRCSTVLDYGVNTEFEERYNSHVCLKCEAVLK